MYYSRLIYRPGLVNNLGIAIVFRHLIVSFRNLAFTLIIKPNYKEPESYVILTYMFSDVQT